MEGFTITKMTKEHIPALAELERICFSTPWSADSLTEELDNRTAHFLTAVTDDGKVMGYIGTFVVCESCYISNIAVFPDYRRRGAASALLAAASENSVKEGAQSISLEVRPSNTAAIALYRGVGFEEVGLRKNFYRYPQEDALILTKTFSCHEVGGTE